jgi:hypothetical protein
VPPTNQQTQDFELANWLSDIGSDGSLTKEEIQSLSTILGKDKVQEKLRNQVLMQRDYSRKTQDLAEQRKQIEQDVNEILAERADLAKWKGDVDGQLKKAYSDLDASRTTTAQFQARMQTISDQTGIPVEELTRGLSAAKAASSDAVVDATRGGGNGAQPNGGPVTFIPDKVVSREDFNRFAHANPLLQAELFDLANEHQELFGKPLKAEYTDSRGVKHTGMRALVIKASEYNQAHPGKTMSLRETWEGDFNVPAKRSEILRESIRTEERGKLDAEYKTKLSGDILNGTPGRATPLADQPKSVLFDQKRDQRTPAEREHAAASGDKAPVNEPPPASAAHREERWQKAAQSYVDRRASGVPVGQAAPVKSGAL